MTYTQGFSLPNRVAQGVGRFVSPHKKETTSPKGSKAQRWSAQRQRVVYWGTGRTPFESAPSWKVGLKTMRHCPSSYTVLGQGEPCGFGITGARNDGTLKMVVEGTSYKIW